MERGEVRENKVGQRFYIEGPYYGGRIPMVNVVEVEGRFVGQRYAVSVDLIEKMEVVSEPTTVKAKAA